MDSKKELTKDMTKGQPAKLLLLFALPLMLGSLFQQLYTMVDTIIVGQGVGINALASLGAADWLNWMFVGFVTGLTQGFSIIFAQYYGAGDIKALRASIGNSIILTAISAVIFTVAGQLTIVPILRILDTPADIFAGAEQYLRVMIGGITVSLVYNFEAALLRALGDSRTPLMAMVTAAVVNVLLDLLFVLVFKWGIIGAASATIIAQGVSLVYCYVAIRKIDIVKLKKGDVVIHADMSRKLLFVGVPIVFQNTVISVGGMILQSVINSYGFLFVAGFTAANKLYGLLETAATSYGFAITTYTAQNLGAGDFKRIKRGMRSAVIMALITSVVISAVMLIFGRPILRLFISNETGQVDEVLGIAYHYLSIMSYFLAVLYALHTYRSALQGLGNTVIPMISGIAEFAMRTAAALLLPRLAGQEGVFYAEILAWTGAAAILVVSYYINVNTLHKKFSNSY